MENSGNAPGKDKKGLFVNGNEWWKKRSKHGRNKIFADPKTLLDAAYEYFRFNKKDPIYISEVIKSGPNAGKIVNVPTTKPLSLKGLCIFLGVNTKYFNDFEDALKPGNPDKPLDADFSEIIRHIKEVIEHQMTTGAAVGTYKENLIARMIGLSDKSNIDLTTKGKELPASDMPKQIKVVIERAKDPDDE